jgi:uncharacterized membrane protein
MAQEKTVVPQGDARPEVNIVELADLWACLRAGWADFIKAPVFGLFFGGAYVLGGWLITWAVQSEGQIWWAVIAGTGFPILGPFVACGLYDISRRLERGEPLIWSRVLGVILRQKDRQIPSMAAVILVFFLFWNFLAHMIFALFLGRISLINVTSSLETYLSANGLMMLAVGGAIGAVLAGVLFALTVVSLPLLLDREVDFITAMLTSLGLVTANPIVMLCWAALIAGLLIAGMLPGFLGLFVVLPVLGHATWHLYRRALD